MNVNHKLLDTLNVLAYPFDTLIWFTGEPDELKGSSPVRARRESRVFNKIDWKVRSLPGDVLFSAPT